MKNFVSIFEIPATNVTRAIAFYKAILDIEIEYLDFPEMQLGLFPVAEQSAYGTIVQGNPSSDGVTIYLDGGEDLQMILNKIEGAGGKIIVPKSQHVDESGFYALFIDSEGNKLGLHSQN